MKKQFVIALFFSFVTTGWGQQTPENSIQSGDRSIFTRGDNELVVKTVNDTTWFVFQDFILMFPTPSKYSLLNKTFSEKDTFYLSLGMGYEQNGLEFTLMDSKLKDVTMEESYISNFIDKMDKDGYRIDKTDWDNMNPDGWKPLIITGTGNFKTNYNGELMDTVKNTPLNLAGYKTKDGKRTGKRHILYKITGAKKNGQRVEYIMVFLILGC